MATYAGRQLTPVAGLNVTERSGVVRFETPLVTPVITTGERVLFVNASNELIYQNGSSSTTIGAAGGGGTPTWETIFAADATFTMTPDNAFTIAGNRATATDVLVITNIGGGSGTALQITNSGSGNDIRGTSSTWSVTAAGVATFVGASFSGTTNALTTTAAADWTLLDNSATALEIGSSGATAMITFDTSNLAEIVRFGNGLSLTDGNATFISTSNTATNVLVTNNTITTFGANASSAGAVCIRSTSLTTGSLLQLQLSDTALAGGFYLNCRESIGATNDFTIGENGVIVMLGTAASDSLTISNGDALMSDGSLTMTDADNAVTLSITNNTATTASVFAFVGSGVFTGSTTTSWLTLTQSGLTTGTAVYLVTAALTSGRALDVVAAAATTSTGVLGVTTAALTSGSAVLVTGGGAAMTSGGKCVEVAMGAATVGAGVTILSSGVYTGAGLLQITGNSATTGVIAQVTANGLTTGTALDLSSSGTITTTGEMLNIAANTATTSTGLVRVSGTGLTDGFCALLTGGGANITATGGVLDVVGGASTAGTVLRVASTGVYTSAVGVVDINAASATSGSIVDVGGAGLTTGSALVINAVAATLTTGFYLRCNDGGVNVFGVARTGHLAFRQTTAPTIVVTTQNGITAAAVTAGSTDSCGIFTTTGTSTGSTVITVTFNAAYAVAPEVILLPANTAATVGVTGATTAQAFISSTTTTTFVVTIPAGAVYAATPSYRWFTIEHG